MLLRMIGMIAAIASAATSAATAQQPALDQIYGNGVHAFFAGDHGQAIDQLSAAIDGGMRDARAHYFRGLAQSRMGNGLRAEDDFAQGAALESAEPEVTPMVSRALQRVQGQTRLKIESHRTKARFAALQQQRARDQARYGRERTEERRTLTKQAEKATTAEEGLFDEKTAPPEGKKAEEKEPVGAPEEAPAVKKAEAKPDETTDPFGDEPKAPEKEPPAAKEDAPAVKEDAPAVKEEPPAAKEEAPAAKEEPPAAKEEMPEEAAPKIEAPATEKPADKKA